MRRSSPELVDRDDAAPPDVVDGRRARAGEQRSGVVAAEQRRREVEHVAIDEAGPVEDAGDRGAALDQDLQDAPAAELVEQLARARPGTRAPAAPWRSGGAWPSTTRSGSRPSTWRTVSAGSSARTVPAPTTMASLSARSAWASARAASPVIHWLVPSGAAVRPSSVDGQLQHDPRPTGAAVLQVRGELAAHRLGLDADRRPRCRPPAAGRCPAPATCGSGSSIADHDPGDARRRSARRRTAAVRPWCEHGSSVVTHGGARGRRRRPPRRATTSAWRTAGRLGRALEDGARRRPRRRSRPTGSARSWPRTRVGERRSPVASPRCRPSLLLGGALDARATVPRTHPRSHPDSHRRLRNSTGSARPGRDGFAGSHRRSGLAPTPREGTSVFVRLSTAKCTAGLSGRDKLRPCDARDRPTGPRPVSAGGRPASRARAWGTTSSTASRHSTAPFGDPGRLSTSARPDGAGDAPRQPAERVHQAHGLGQAGRLAVDGGPGALRGEVAGPEAGAAGRDDQAGEARRTASREGARPPTRRRRRRRGGAVDGEAGAGERSRERRPAAVLAGAVGDAVGHDDDRGRASGDVAVGSAIATPTVPAAAAALRPPVSRWPAPGGTAPSRRCRPPAAAASAPAAERRPRRARRVDRLERRMAAARRDRRRRSSPPR